MSGDEPKRPGLEIGQVFAGRYTVERELGAGAAARIYLARQVVIDRPVALKILRGQDDDRQAALLLREARILRSLPPHPAIVDYLDMGIVGGVAYLVEEYVEGATLGVWQRGARGIPELVEMYRKIAEGLAALHAAGVVHRDLKPSNVLVEAKTGQPKLTDMGLALRPSEADTLTQSAIVGTPMFMAPEVIGGSSSVGAPADVYALGVMLYGAIVGALPWGDSTDTASQSQVAAMLRAILEGPTDEAFTRLAARVSGRMVALVREMLARAPEQRPIAAEVARRLDPGLLLEGAPPATAAGPRGEAPAAATPRAAPIATATPTPVPLAATRPSELSRGSTARSGPARYLAPIAITAALLIGAALLRPHDAALSFSPVGTFLNWLWKPGPALALVARTAGWATVAVLGGAMAVASVVAYRRWRRRTEAAVAEALPVLARIQAIEGQLKTQGSPTKSMFVALDQIDVDAFKQQLRESVVVALQDLRGHLGSTEAGAPSDLGRALEVIAGLTQRKKTPVRPNHAKQIALYVGLFAGGATAITGIAGALGAVDVWHPNRAPAITRVSPSGDRVRRGVPVRLAVDAKDPDGDPLTFTFDVGGQTLPPSGPTVLWRPPADPRDAVVTFTVTVGDGHKKTVGYGTFVLDSPPAIARLDVPARVRAGETAVLSADAADPDGDEVKYAWTVSAGEPLGNAASVFAWRAPARPGHVDVVLVASDGLDTTERRTTIAVVAR